MIDDQALDRPAPWSEEAEVAVLGAMTQSKDAIPVALETLTPGMFYREAHRRLFQAMTWIWERGVQVDPITLADQLKTTHELDAVGGIDYIGYLVDVVPNAAHIAHHATIVREKAQLRRLVEVSSETIRDVYDQGTRSVAEVIGDAETRVMALGETVGRDYVRAKFALMGVFEEIERLQLAKAENPEEVPGIATGLHDLDRKMLGLHGGQLTVIAARPSMGKTALAMGWAVHAAIRGTPTYVLSFEMGVGELLMRALASEGRVNLQRVRGGEKLANIEHNNLAAAAGHLNTAPLFIDDSPDTSLMSVTGRIRRAVKQDEIQLVVVDYLQLMKSVIGDGRREQIDSITRALKNLAKALDIPIVLLSQLSRGPENRTDKRPMLSDLRESGAIEQDADNVIMLYRPEYYMNAQQLGQMNGNEGLTELLIPKQRNGPTGTVKVHFEKTTTRFQSISRGGPQPD